MSFNQKIVYKIIKQIIACMLSGVVIIPFLVILVNSFKTESEAALMDLSLLSRLDGKIIQ